MPAFAYSRIYIGMLCIYSYIFLNMLFIFIDPCDPDPCVRGTCVPTGDEDYFCDCYICGCGADYVSKTCDFSE